MKIIFIVTFGVTILTVPNSAQVSPVPVADTEVRDSTSIRMRSLEFERAKRDANQPHPTVTSKLIGSRFVVIKEDFENIQELQAAIVKAYETGAKIDYEKIGDLSLEMKKKASRLRANFFDINEAGDTSRGSEIAEPKSIRDLIIELDGTLAVFVGSPLFAKSQVISAKSADEAKANLEKIISLSSELHKTAEKRVKR